MTGLKTRMRALLGSLPPSERKAARLVLDRTEEALGFSIHRTARESGVSVASVNRLCRSLGLAGFRDFKIALARDTVSPASSILPAIGPRDSDGEIIEKVFAANTRSLQETLKILNRNALRQAVQAILKAKRILIFGVGGSGIIAQDAALMLNHLDIPAEAEFDAYRLLVQVLRLKKGDVAVAVSHSGRSKATVEALKIARERGAVTIGISNYDKTPLARETRIYLCTAFPEDRVKSVAISSRLAQLCLFDAMYLLAARHKKALWDVEKVNEVTERIVRSAPRR